MLKEIYNIIINTLQGTSQKIFDISQRNVPIKSGDLKRSGSIQLIDNGAIIQYLSSYAAINEFGRTATPIKGNQTVHIREYTRRSYLRKDGVRIDAAIIPAHDIIYKNKRLIPIRNGNDLIFRVISRWPERKGTFFLTRAIQEGFQSFLGDLQNNLKRRFE